MYLDQLCGFWSGGANFPVFVGAAVQNATATVPSASVYTFGPTLPAGIANGDLIIVAVYENDWGTSDILNAGLTGTTLLANVSTGGGRLYVWSLIYNSVTHAALSGTFTNACYYETASIAYRGAAVDVTGSIATGAVANSVTTTAGMDMIVGLFISRAGSSSVDTITAPASFTEKGEAKPVAGPFNNLMICDRQFQAAGATGTATATVTTTADGALLIAVKPV